MVNVANNAPQMFYGKGSLASRISQTCLDGLLLKRGDGDLIRYCVNTDAKPSDCRFSGLGLVLATHRPEDR